MAHATAQFFGPLTLGRGQKVNYHVISITQSISNIFKPNFVLLLTNDRYKHIRQDFHSVPRGWTWRVRGVQNCVFRIFNQIWCVSYSHEWHMQQHNYFGPRTLGPWGGAKRSNIIKFHLPIFIRSQVQYLGGQNLHFLTTVMWHINLKSVDQDTLEYFTLGSNW